MQALMFLGGAIAAVTSAVEIVKMSRPIYEELKTVDWTRVWRDMRRTVTPGSPQNIRRLSTVVFQQIRGGVSIWYMSLSLLAKRVYSAQVYFVVFMMLIEMTTRVDTRPGWKNLSIQGAVTVVWIGAAFFGYLFWPGMTNWDVVNDFLERWL
jgi:hypothetical protein